MAVAVPRAGRLACEPVADAPDIASMASDEPGGEHSLLLAPGAGAKVFAETARAAADSFARGFGDAEGDGPGIDADWCLDAALVDDADIQAQNEPAPKERRRRVAAPRRQL